jgi:hypothetical protein
MDRLSSQAEMDFDRARFRAFLREAANLIARRPNELLSFDAVQRSLVTYGSSYRGVQTVPLAQIVGSATNRYADFDRAFLPAQVRTKSRWKRIDQLRMAGEVLPPVQLFKVGDLYFVRDGHHRVSVARETGQEFIDAEVIEVRTRVPLTSFKDELEGNQLEIIGEYADFVEKTQLDRLRPEAQIKFSDAGGYARLLEHIVVHRYFMGLDLKREISWEEAVADWYDSLYMPIVRIIREQNILADFPNRTEADLYLWIMDHHHYLQERGEPALARAAEDFAVKYSPRLSRKLARVLHNLIAEWRGAHAPKNDYESQTTVTAQPDGNQS